MTADERRVNDPTSIRLGGLRARLEARAAREGMTLTELIKQACEEHLAKPTEDAQT